MEQEGRYVRLPDMEALADEVAVRAKERLLNSDYHGRTIREWMELISKAERREFCEKCGACVMFEPDPEHCEIYQAAHGGDGHGDAQV